MPNGADIQLTGFRKGRDAGTNGLLPMISRRALLTGTGAALALGTVVIGSPPAYTPRLERPLTLQERWVEAITARARILHPSRRMRDHLRSLDADVRTYLDSAERASGDEGVFRGYQFDGKDSSALSGTATRLATLARAWSTPESAFS